MKYNFTKDQLLTAQKECQTLEKMAIKFNCSWKIIKKWMIYYNISYSRPSVQFEVEHLIELYNKYENFVQVAKDLNVTPAQVRYFFNRENILYKKEPRYTYNHDFFSLEKPESFYWAGFLAADGSIVKNTIKCELSIKDKEHLKILNQVLCNENKLNINNRKSAMLNCNLIPERQSVSVAFTSYKMVQDLKEKFNIVSNKSLIYKFPIQILQHKLLRDFIRGIIDGDGSFYINHLKNKKSPQLCLKICGTKDLLKNIIKIFYQEKIINKDTWFIETKGNVNTIQFLSPRTVKKIYDYIYKDSIVYLERKYNLSTKYFNELNV